MIILTNMMKRFRFAAVLLCTVVGLIYAQAPDTATSPVAGKWHFVFDTEGGPREYDANFTVDDGKAGGTFGKSEVKGVIKGNDLNLEFPVNSEEAGEGVLKLTGKQADGELTGKWSFQTYDGTFRATRPKPQ